MYTADQRKLCKQIVINNLNLIPMNKLLKLILDYEYNISLYYRYV